MTIVGLRDFVKVSNFSRIQVLFADHMHWRTGVDNKLSFLRYKIWCRQAPIFPKVIKMLLFHAPSIFNALLASFHAASRAPLLLPLCLFLRPILKFWSVGAALMRFTWANISERRIFVSNFSVDVQWPSWILHVGIGFCMSGLFRRIDFGGFMSWKTQPKCRAFDDRRPVGPRFNSWHVSRILIMSHRSVGTFNMVDYRFLYIFMPIILLQHSKLHSCHHFFDLLLGCSSTWRCAYEHFSPNRQPTLGLVEQAFWRVPLFTRMNWCKFLWGNPCKGDRYILPLGTLSSGTSGSRWFSLILLHERIRRRIRLCHFSTLIDIVAETAIVSSGTLPVELPLPTISKNSLYTLFWFLILDHGVSLIITISGAKIFYSVYLARYFFSPSSSICDNQVLISSDESPGRTIPIRSWVSRTLVLLVCTILPRCHQVGFSS